MITVTLIGGPHNKAKMEIDPFLVVIILHFVDMDTDKIVNYIKISEGVYQYLGKDQ